MPLKGIRHLQHIKWTKNSSGTGERKIFASKEVLLKVCLPWDSGMKFLLTTKVTFFITK